MSLNLISKVKNFFTCKVSDEDYRFIPNPYHYMKLRDENNDKYRRVNIYLFEKFGHPVNKRVFYEIALNLLLRDHDEDELYTIMKRFKMN